MRPEWRTFSPSRSTRRGFSRACAGSAASPSGRKRLTSGRSSAPRGRTGRLLLRDRRRLLDLPGHGDKAYWEDVLLGDPAVGGLPKDLELLEEAADGDHHDASRSELIEEGLGDPLRGRRDDDAVERRVLGPAAVAVPFAHGDVAVTELLHPALGEPGELGNDLDSVDVVRELRQHRALVTRAGPDLEHARRGRELEELRHERDDVGLGDRLVPGDRKRMILVRLRALSVVDEAVSRDLSHRGEHSWVSHAPSDDLGLHHAAPPFGVRIRWEGGHARAVRRPAVAGGRRHDRRKEERGRMLHGPDPAAPAGDQATRPFTTVRTTGMFGISASGAVIGSFAKTVRSAAKPSAIFPRLPSSKAAQAASEVNSARASALVSRSEALQPPAGRPARSLRVTAE